MRPSIPFGISCTRAVWSCPSRPIESLRSCFRSLFAKVSVEIASTATRNPRISWLSLLGGCVRMANRECFERYCASSRLVSFFLKQTRYPQNKRLQYHSDNNLRETGIAVKRICFTSKYHYLLNCGTEMFRISFLTYIAYCSFHSILFTEVETADSSTIKACRRREVPTMSKRKENIITRQCFLKAMFLIIKTSYNTIITTIINHKKY